MKSWLLSIAMSEKKKKNWRGAWKLLLPSATEIEKSAELWFFSTTSYLVVSLYHFSFFLSLSLSQKLYAYLLFDSLVFALSLLLLLFIPVSKWTSNYIYTHTRCVYTWWSIQVIAEKTYSLTSKETNDAKNNEQNKHEVWKLVTDVHEVHIFSCFVRFLRFLHRRGEEKKKKSKLEAISNRQTWWHWHWLLIVFALMTCLCVFVFLFFYQA